MLSAWFCVFLLGFSAIVVVAGESDDAVTRVRTQVGWVEGFVHANADGSRSHVYLGLRYAAPPVGDLRFEKPQAYPEVPGVIQAKAFGPACPQIHRDAMRDVNVSEDCLSVNIIRPEARPVDPTGYPIFLFVHGGGFVNGAASRHGFKSLSENFAAHGIMAVTVQYRIGALGFFSTGDSTMPGNLGLWDLMYALHFLSQILPNFHGNPRDITIYGNSAGAAAVHALTLSPHSNFMIKRAVQSSGSLFSEWAMTEHVVDVSTDLARRVGCKQVASAEIRDCMKSAPLESILDAVEAMGTHNTHVRQFLFHPRLDDEFFPHGIEMLTKAMPDIPVLFGVAELEWARIANLQHHEIFNPTGIRNKAAFGATELQEYIADQLLHDLPPGKARGALRNALFERFTDVDGANASDYLRLAVQVVSDVMFIVPVIQQVQLRTALDQQTFLLHHTYFNADNPRASTHVHGAIHGNDQYYVFDSDIRLFDFNDADRVFKDNFLQGIRSFVVSGRPKSGTTRWPETSKRLPTRHVELRPEPVVLDEFEPDRMKFWNDHLPKRVDVDVLQHRLPQVNLYLRHTEL